MKENRFENEIYVDHDDNYLNYLNKNLQKINFALETKINEEREEEKIKGSNENTNRLPIELNLCVSHLDCSSHKVSFSKQLSIQNVHKEDEEVSDVNHIEIYFLHDVYL